jgi:ADP-heptose:LPS heptosyltransferase
MPWARRTPVFFRPRAGDRHRADTHLELVTRLGIRPYEAKIRLPFDLREERKVEGWLENSRVLVVMVPGARSHLKRWGAEKFAEVADRLIERNNAQVLLAGEEAERPIANQMVAAMRNTATDLVGKTTVRQLADLMSHAKLVVTNDIACFHMASLAGSPTVAVCASTPIRATTRPSSSGSPRAPSSAIPFPRK